MRAGRHVPPRYAYPREQRPHGGRQIACCVRAVRVDTQGMVMQVVGWCVFVVTLAGVSLALWGLVHVSRQPRVRCPGPASWARRTLPPASWIFRPICGYDLTGLPESKSLELTCPECGRRSRPRQRLRSDRSFKPFAASLLLCILAGMAIALGWTHSGSWTRLTPSTVLVTLERHAPTRLARPARREVFRRIDDSHIAAIETPLICRMLIAELADDGRSMNATYARQRLRDLWPASRPALEVALTSSDRQTRFLAGELLRERLASDPPDALLDVCIENLADERSGSLAYYLSWGKVTTSVHFLIMHIDRAEPLLGRAMLDGDYQQRLIAAAIIAECRRERLIHRAAPILVHHLGDNDVEGDAQIATAALLACGDAIIPYLEPHRHDPDAQRRQLSRAILAHLGCPTDNANPTLDTPPRITSGVDDPLTLLPLSRRGSLRLLWP